MKITLELTEKIIAALDADQAKEILRNLITPAHIPLNVEIKVDAQQIKEELNKVKEALTPVPVLSAEVTANRPTSGKPDIIKCGDVTLTPEFKLVEPKIITKKYYKQHKIVSDEVIKAIGKRYTNGEQLKDILDGTDLKYSTVYCRLQTLGVIAKKK